MNLLQIKWPIFFMTAIGLFLNNPDQIFKYTPHVFGQISNSSILPQQSFVYPKTTLEAWQLGYLTGLLNYHPQNFAMDVEIRGENVKITPAQLLQIRSAITDMESKQSVIQRVIGCFTFINFIWLLSIIGIMTTIYPVILLIAEPVHKLLEYLFTEYILPILRAIKPLYEAILWIISYILIVNAFRYHDIDSRVFVCITGVFAMNIAIHYTIYLHLPYIDTTDYHLLLSLIFAIVCIPLSIRLNSVLMGFIGVGAIYNALGFSISNWGLCYFIGFNNETALERCLLSSFMLLILLLFGHVMYPDLLLSSLTPALNTLGSITYYIALLIKTQIASEKSYWPLQIWMIGSLNITCFIGSIYQIESIRNVSMLFIVLYILEKTCDIIFRAIHNIALVIFIISIVFWKVSLYLHQNPVVLMSIFGLE